MAKPLAAECEKLCNALAFMMAVLLAAATILLFLVLLLIGYLVRVLFFPSSSEGEAAYAADDAMLDGETPLAAHVGTFIGYALLFGICLFVLDEAFLKDRRRKAGSRSASSSSSTEAQPPPSLKFVGDSWTIGGYLRGEYFDPKKTKALVQSEYTAGSVAVLSFVHYCSNSTTPWTCSEKENFEFSLEVGGKEVKKIVEIDGDTRHVKFTIIKAGRYQPRVTYSGDAISVPSFIVIAALPKLEKCVINPPVVHSVKGQQFHVNLQFYDEFGNEAAALPAECLESSVIKCDKGYPQCQWDGSSIEPSGGNGYTLTALSLTSGLFAYRIDLNPARLADDHPAKAKLRKTSFDITVLVLTEKENKSLNTKQEKKDITHWVSGSYYKTSRQAWAKCWMYLTPSQVYVKESWGIFFTTKVWSARKSVNTSIVLLASEARSNGNLGPHAAEIADKMTASASTFMLDDKSSRPVLLKSKDRNLFLGLYSKALVTSASAMTFEEKMEHFLREGKLSASVKIIRIARSTGFPFAQEMYSKLNPLTSSDWANTFKISYAREAGLDYGGLTREFLSEGINLLFSQDLGLFRKLEGTELYHVAPDYPREHVKLFRLAGFLLGKSLIETKRRQTFSPVRLSKALRSHLLGVRVTAHSFATDDPELYQQKILYILMNDVTDLDMTFTDVDQNGEEVPICKNGENMPVTNENKHKYIQALASHRLVAQVKDPLKELEKGFLTVVNADGLSVFDESDLELAMCGLVDFEATHYIQNARVSAMLANKSQTIGWLTNIIDSFSREQRSKFLQFVTGTASVPAGGFSAYDPQMIISPMLDKIDCLPEAHTCFNQLVMPEYTSYEKCQQMMLIAITEGYAGFSML